MADLRQACDRCHDKKLRCPKIPGRPGSCTRCLKAGVQCAFSPPTRPSGAAARSDQWASLHSQGAGQPVAAMLSKHSDWTDLMDFDQAGVAYEAFHCGPNLTIEHPLEEQPNPASLPSAVTLTHQISLSVGSSSSSSSEVMSQLTSMISGLERANQSMITLRGSHTSKERFQDWAEDVRKSFDLSNTLESILIHTESLATLYSTVSKLISSANQPRHRQDCHLPDCIHEYAQDRPDTPSLTQHYSLLNMLLSCHFKVLDIVDSIIGLCNTCSRTIVALPMVQDAHFDFPQIRIGSFVASPSATVPLFTTMLCQLLLDLQEKNRDMSRSLSLSPQGDGVADSRELQLLNLQSDIIKDRTAGTLESMRRTQAYFLDKGIVK